MALFISVITAPYGWSFDVVVLLIPLLQCFVWMLEKSIPLTATVLLGLAYILANITVLYQRSLGVGEEAYFWFPLFLALFYVWGWKVKKATLEDSIERSPNLLA